MGDGQIKLIDLISVETLQNIQDAFEDICNIAVGISDENGVLLTETKSATEFCGKYNKKSPLGRTRCEQCDKEGSERAIKKGGAVIYHCHSGLVDFAAPIIAHGKRVGGIVGGQIRTEELDEQKLAEYAVEIGVDPEEYLEAARKIRYVETEEINRSAQFMQQIAAVISDMAYDRYELLRTKQEVEHAAQMKSDFLANMSHEIRTPMNAVIGMAEMALREELPPVARDYISQIIASGKTLLTIINDILDLSKVEAGKMAIEEEEYEPMSLINDVANIINTRIGEKDVELILDIAPNLPCKLWGDLNRLKQVIINLSNNAVKFTNQGKVVLHVDYKKSTDDSILLEVAVQDTGIGIKEEDLIKLFQAFQQLDSKRNRNIEGTGLGLTIAEKIVTLMGGEIKVESEYGKGSTFSFWVPQKVFDSKPSVCVEKVDVINAAGLIANDFLRAHMERDMELLGVKYFSLESEEQLNLLEEKKVTHFFAGQAMFSPRVMEFVIGHPELKTILMIDFREYIKTDLQNLLIVKKPVYVLNIASILNGRDVDISMGGLGNEDCEFTAPEAKILIVDDNAINLTVAEGLLRPLNMQIETALSGKQAVAMISEKMYDLIFMDHMMPELDGVETTHIIRRFHPEYKDVPIIALTANAVSGTKEMFLAEGMNDFVAKPIEMRTILTKLRAWLPKEKVKKVTSAIYNQEQCQIEIPELNTEAALKLLGTEKLFWAVLKDYYNAIEKKAELIGQLEQKEDWHNYTIEVHALKSASRQVGALELSELAAEMEKAGNANNANEIHRKTDSLLKKYRRYSDILRPYFPQQKEMVYEQEVTPEIEKDFVDKMSNALDELDMDVAGEILSQMSSFKNDKMKKDLLKQMQEAVGAYDSMLCEELLCKWIMLSNGNVKE